MTNNKRPNPASKSWCFTLNNYTDEECEFLEERLVLLCTVMYASKEVAPSTGTPHIQGYLTLKRTKRQKAMEKLLPRAHWEVAKADKNEQDCYIFKPDSEVFIKLDNGGKGKRNDITDFMEEWALSGDKRKAVANDVSTYVKFHKGLEKAYQILHVDHRVSYPMVTWVYGPTGIQKTKMGEDIAIDTGGDYCLVSELKWFHGYEQQNTCILDEVDKDGERLPIKLLLQLCDRYKFNVPVKGAYAIFNSDYIVITSTNNPRHLMSDSDWSQMERRICNIGTRTSQDVPWTWEKGQHPLSIEYNDFIQDQFPNIDLSSDGELDKEDN